MTSVWGAYPLYAEGFRLPAPGMRVSLSPAYNPPILKGIKVDPDNPFRFEFILDQGDRYDHHPGIEAAKLIKYFLASLTIPEKDLWVNLSPYEKNRIIPSSFGLTEMGRDLLAEDYMLKQITASLIYPEGEVGKKFWKRIYAEAAQKFGTTNIPINTFNKVWIVPEKAVVYENAQAGTAYVVDSTLKVMLEQDYLSLQKHSPVLPLALRNDVASIGANIVREIVIPELNREVNQDKNFAQLRQVYNSLILAAWYKRKIKESILAQVYEDKKKVAGIGFKNSINIEAIYQRYLQAFKKGVYNYIKEEPDPITQQVVQRKYFSGGVNFFGRLEIAETTDSAMIPVSSGRFVIVRSDFAMAHDRAMTVSETYAFTMPPVINAGALNKIAKRVADHLRDHFMQQTGLWQEKGLRLMFMNGGLKFKDQFDKEITLKEAIDNSVNAIADRAEETGADYTGKISLQVTLTDQGYVLEVEDNGIGMGKDILETKILNFGTSRPITKLSNNNKRIGGSGFGSRVTLKFLKDHHGVLQVETFKGQKAWVLTKDYSAQNGSLIVEGQRKVPGAIVRWVIPADRAMTLKPIVDLTPRAGDFLSRYVIDAVKGAIPDLNVKAEEVFYDPDTRAPLGKDEHQRVFTFSDRARKDLFYLNIKLKGHNISSFVLSFPKGSRESLGEILGSFKWNSEKFMIIVLLAVKKFITKGSKETSIETFETLDRVSRSAAFFKKFFEKYGASFNLIKTGKLTVFHADLNPVFWDSLKAAQKAIQGLSDQAMRVQSSVRDRQVRTDFRRDAQRFRLRLVPPRIVFQRFTELSREERARIWDDVRTWERPDGQGGRRLFFETKDGKSRWDSEGSDAIIAFQNGKPVGALGFLLMSSLSKAWENGIFVKDEARGKGIALKLTSELFIYLRERNYKRVAYGFEESAESQGLAQGVLGQFGQILASKGEYQDHKISILTFDLEKHNPDDQLSEGNRAMKAGEMLVGNFEGHNYLQREWVYDEARRLIRTYLTPKQMAFLVEDNLSQEIAAWVRDGRVISFMVYLAYKRESLVRLSFMFTDPAYAGKGVGTALCLDLFKNLQERGFKEAQTNLLTTENYITEKKHNTGLSFFKRLQNILGADSVVIDNEMSPRARVMLDKVKEARDQAMMNWFQPYIYLRTSFSKHYSDQGWWVAFDEDKAGRMASDKAREEAFQTLNKIIIETFKAYRGEYFATGHSRSNDHRINDHREEGYIYVPQDIPREELAGALKRIQAGFTAEKNETVSFAVIKARDIVQEAQDGKYNDILGPVLTKQRMAMVQTLESLLRKVKGVKGPERKAGYGNGIAFYEDEAMMTRSIDEAIKSWVQGGEKEFVFTTQEGVIFKFKHHMGEERSNEHQIDAFLNDRKVGYIHFEMRHHLNGPTTVWMEDGFRPHDRTSRNFGSQRVALFVDPEVTRFKNGNYKGVGQSLLGLAERLAFDEGASKFYASGVGGGNFNFYSKLGYRDAELAPFYDLHQTVVKTLSVDEFSKIGIEDKAQLPQDDRAMVVGEKEIPGRILQEQGWKDREIAFKAMGFRPGDRVINIDGYADNRSALFVASHGGDYTSFDLNSYNQMVTNSILEGYGLSKKARAVTGYFGKNSSASGQIPDHSVGIVMSGIISDPFSDNVDALEEAIRVIKPGGTIAVISPPGSTVSLELPGIQRTIDGFYARGYKDKVRLIPQDMNINIKDEFFGNFLMHRIYRVEFLGEHRVQAEPPDQAMNAKWKLIEYFRAKRVEKKAQDVEAEDDSDTNKKIWEISRNIIMVHLINNSKLLKDLERIVPRFHRRTTLTNPMFPLFSLSKDSIPINSDLGEFIPESYEDSVFIGGSVSSCLARSIAYFSKAAFQSGRKEVTAYLLAPYIWTGNSKGETLEDRIQQLAREGRPFHSFGYGKFLQENFSVSATIKVSINGKEKIFDGKDPDHVLVIDIIRANDQRLRINKAMVVQNGGIDLTPARVHIETRAGSPSKTFGDGVGGIKFHISPAMLAELKNAPGFVPVIISEEPVTDLRGFLMNK